MGRGKLAENLAEPLIRSERHNTLGEGCMGVGESKAGSVDGKRSTWDNGAVVL